MLSKFYDRKPLNSTAEWYACPHNQTFCDHWKFTELIQTCQCWFMLANTLALRNSGKHPLLNRHVFPEFPCPHALPNSSPMKKRTPIQKCSLRWLSLGSGTKQNEQQTTEFYCRPICSTNFPHNQTLCIHSPKIHQVHPNLPILVHAG